MWGRTRKEAESVVAATRRRREGANNGGRGLRGGGEEIYDSTSGEDIEEGERRGKGGWRRRATVGALREGGEEIYDISERAGGEDRRGGGSREG
jgi:hypothetical protein